MTDCDPFVSPDMSGIDSVQSTINSAAGSEFLTRSCETLTTDDETLTTDRVEVGRPVSSDLSVLEERTAETFDNNLHDDVRVNFVNATEVPVVLIDRRRSRTVSVAVDNGDILSSIGITKDGVLEVPPAPFIAPDGGWGWVIVAVSFLCAAVVDGLCSVFGVLLPSLVTYFEQSSSRIAFAGSLLAGGFQLFGPVGSVLINCVGCRTTTIIGATVSAISLLTAPYAPNVEVFILLFGLLGGFGISLIYLPASVMVGYYFERRRGIAAGIASSGAGFGMLVLSPLAALLEDEYSWKGTLVVLAGVSLNCIVWGALMRPLPVLKPYAADTDKCDDSIWNNHAEIDDADLEPETVIITTSLKNRQFAVTRLNSVSESESKTKDDSLFLASRLVPDSKYSSKYQSACTFEEADRVSMAVSQITGPLQRPDIFYSGSVMSLHHDVRSSVAHLSSIYSYEMADQSSKCCRVAPGTCTTMCQMLDVSLFRNTSFVIICLASCFIQLAYFVPVVFITPYAMSLGMSPSSAAALLSVAGVSNMIGRSAAGALATLPFINNLHLNNISLIITGIATALVTVLCTGFSSLIVYSVVFGLSVAAFVPLTTIFLVQYVGLEKLTNAYGLLSMVKGVATMIGPPVAGALLDATQTYSSTFYFAGSMFVLAGLLYYLLKLTNRCKFVSADV